MVRYVCNPHAAYSLFDFCIRLLAVPLLRLNLRVRRVLIARGRAASNKVRGVKKDYPYE